MQRNTKEGPWHVEGLVTLCSPIPNLARVPWLRRNDGKLWGLSHFFLNYKENLGGFTSLSEGTINIQGWPNAVSELLDMITLIKTSVPQYWLS